MKQASFGCWTVSLMDLQLRSVKQVSKIDPVLLQLQHAAYQSALTASCIYYCVPARKYVMFTTVQYITLQLSLFNHRILQIIAFAGTNLLYRPGILEGGTLEHNCSLQRSIGYFLEPLLMLAPFAKRQICITLHGITNGTEDPSVSKSKQIKYHLC